MKKIICLLVVFLSSGIFVSSVWAEIKKADFITLTFPKGITLDVPRSWKIAIDIDEHKETTYLSLAEIHQPRMTFDESILIEINDNKNTIILEKYVPSKIIPVFEPGYGAILYIGYLVPDSAGPGQAEVEAMTNLKNLSETWFAEMQKNHAHNNFILFDWSGLSKMKINNFTTIYYTLKMQHIDDQGFMEIEAFIFYLGEDSFTIAIYYLIDKKLHTTMEVRRIINSARIEK